MAEQDVIMEAEAGPSTRPSSSSSSSSPLAFDLLSACRSIYRDSGATSAQEAASIGIENCIVSATYDTTNHDLSSMRISRCLSNLLSHPSTAPIVIRHCGPILLQLLSIWLNDTSIISVEIWESRLSIVASLAEIRPDLWSFIDAFISVSPFQASPLVHIQSQEFHNADTYRLHDLLLAYNRLLIADPNIAKRNEWSLDTLHLLRSQHPDTGVRLLAIQALSRARQWSEQKRTEVELESIGKVDEVDCPVAFGWESIRDDTGVTFKRTIIDGWLFPVREAQQVDLYRADTPAVEMQKSSSLCLTPSDLTPRIAFIADTLLLRATPMTTTTSIQHVATSAATSALRDIIPLLQLGLPTLITSSPSSGKTHILHYLSSQIYPTQQPTNRILTIPLADTTIDVKSLIGTYVSSPTKPGTFEWMEGALAKAVRAGRWVVFDDIDRGSTEMLVTVAGLARSLRPGRSGRRARLAVPGRDEIEAGSGFAMFATRTTRSDIVPPSFFGHHNFTEVVLDAPTDEDILAILSASFPRIPQSATKTLVTIWQLLRPLSNIGGPVKGRDIGLRDLEKWCARIDRNLPSAAVLAALESNPSGPFANPVLQDEILLEAADTFMAWFDARSSSLEKRASMIRVVAEHIGMDEERAFALLDTRRPALEISSSSKQLRVGRSSMPIFPSSRRQRQTDSRPFAMTKPSLVLLERIAATASMGEPTLLVGETGTGKTTAVQHIATICRKPLTALNLSTQTESSDLLGGFKPIDAGVAARVLQTRWQQLFTETFSMAKAQNGAYLEAASKALAGRKWARLAELWASSARRAVDKLTKKDEQPSNGDSSPRKRRKVNSKVTKAGLQWQSLLVDIADFDLHHVKMKSKLVFSFVEGPLVKALREGEWLLLDEVNLASQETLEAISTLLEGTAASLVLTERGDVEPIPRHPDFRLFACMNPATDVGKKDLPPNLRARFTELYVPPPDDDREALTTIVAQYLGDAAAGDRAVILDVVEMYSTLKRLSATKEIVDGSNTAPHFSMRTLARALMFAEETAPVFGLRRGLWEGCLMAFTMSLDLVSAQKAHAVCEKYLLSPMKNARAVLSQIPSLPAGADPDDYVRFGPFWLKHGPLPPAVEDRYVITPSVQAKLSDLARVILTHRYPVLIQGPTSAGKTSAVEFLAKQTGHRFVRINNHEHTDIQEYLGTYVTDPQSGNLVFQEGLLVTAVRQGHWIVLDELNLAPTDVLEALNRLLDDNRELVIPETQEVIKPHPNFILFATQNPPGLYAGRKVLSRAFRNRFLEVHFDDVPKDELETILCQRCQVAPSYAKKIVQVFEELRHRRQASRVFESKSSFATLRDLFRWAERGAVGYEQLANDGYMLLAERARQPEDKTVIKTVIEDIMKITIDESSMYRLFDTSASALARLPFNTVPPASMVWTNAMQRLFALVASALAHNEPVLLVGETGCGKTSICEVVSAAFAQRMVGVNCHQNMETADLLGSQRPVRNRHERRAKVIAALSALAPIPASASDDELASICQDLLRTPEMDHEAVRAIEREIKAFSALFEWSDGPLVHAMMKGDLLLLDEVSLADDSVLERLNSVLEPGRTLVLAEKGGTDIDEATLVAHSNFHVVATMNPGGDFGKKELSPALRNRFTEIWVPPLDDRSDLLQIIGQSWQNKLLEPCGPLILDFFAWFGQRVGDTAGLGLRDILAWVNFADMIIRQGQLDIAQAYHHGGQLVLVDGLESLPQIAGMSVASVAILRNDCMTELSRLASSLGGQANYTPTAEIRINETTISVGGFGIQRGSLEAQDVQFRLEAPTTALNAMRVLRGCQLPKAILLEGSPGVGKTSLVSALAAMSGHHLQRINLSDQTDLIDLFGSDLPVEGGAAGEFQWRDAAFLDAMQKGDWVLLDEMNLASQTVLEGLNAVLDHRGTVYIPELGRSFDRHPDFRVFAAQNPLQQGGGRKGLPKSFLNRFTKVYLQEHTPEDLLMICKSIHPMDEEIVKKMITFNEAIREATMVSRTIGMEGSPWEFNLRDLFRWFSLLSAPNGLKGSSSPLEHLRLVYIHRFRNARDRLAVSELFDRIFEIDASSTRPTPYLTPSHLQIGHSLVARSTSGHATIGTTLPHQHLDLAESVLKSIEMGWLVILAGSSGIGKRRIIRAIADGAGRSLGEFAMHPGVDTSEILGSFEQQDFGRLVDNLYTALTELVDSSALSSRPLSAYKDQLRSAKEACRTSTASTDGTIIAAFANMAETIIEAAEGTKGAEKARMALKTLSKAGPNSTGFAWVDGQLLDALRNGGWYLISNANLCSASVLDRLNSLCENNGVLVLSEKGSETGTPEVIRPHPDFRLFMTFDPRYGELSRAMRNRGVELYVESVTEGHEEPPVLPHALAEQSILQSLALLDAAEITTASFVANEVILQNAAGQAYLDRLLADRSFGQHVKAFLADPTVHEHLQQITEHLTLPTDFKKNLPIDVSTNPQVKAVDINIIFRLLQLFLRNIDQKIAIETFVSMSANNKSILALSVQASRRGVTRGKKAAGAELWPFISSIRTYLAESLGPVVAESSISTPSRVHDVEEILVLLGILESRAQSTTFDFSATQLLAQWLRDLLSNVSTLQSSLIHLNSLAQTVEITTGQGQSEIWALMRKPDDRLILEEGTRASLNNVRDPALRYSMLQALVAATAKHASGTLKDLEQLVQSMPALPIAAKGKWMNNEVLSDLELVALSSALVGSASQDSLRVLVSEPNANLLDYVDLGCVGSEATTPSTLFSALTTWMSTAWSGQNDEENRGPAAIFSPTSLSSVLRFSGQRETAMSEIPQQEEALRFAIDSVLWRARQKPQPRRETLQVVLSALVMMLSAFGLQVDPKQMPTTLLEQLRDTFAGNVIPTWLTEGYRSTLSEAVTAVDPTEPTLADLASLYIGLSQLVVRLYVTNIPIDPAVRRILLGEVISQRIALLREELDAIQAGEMRLKGTPDSRRTVDTQSRLDELLAEQSGLGPSSSRSADVARLNVLFNEVHGFVEDALQPKQTKQLLESLKRHDPQALQREEAFQAVTAAFIHRLESNYKDMADLVQPIVTAVYLTKFGFRMLARQAQLERANRSDLTVSILSFPTPPLLNVTSTDILSHILGAASVARTLAIETRRSTNLPVFMTAIDNLYSTWSAIRLREQRDAQEADSLYRVKKTDVEVLSDVEQEEKEFKELFPSFEGVGEEPDKDVAEVQVRPKEEGKFTSDHVLAFHRLLTSAYNNSASTNTFTDAVDQLIGYLDAYNYDESLDETSLAFQIKQLHRRGEEVSSITVQPNFYLSPNEPEVRKAHSILTRMASRLASLIAEWPEQMVLQHILDRVERVLALDLRSSVAKVLSALEGLLLHTDDWEGYANKENSLKGHQTEMSNLIIEWRKLELASWMRLLEDQAKAYIDSDAEWTLRLYGALIHGSLSVANAEEHIKTVLPLLNTYLSSSTLGHYAPRLSTLRAFEKMANEMALLSTSAEHIKSLRSISTLLHNVLANSTLFAPRIADSLATQRAAMDKSIKDYVRLASWKDVNVYALKASAVNSHRHLHRSIRKFRAALSQPVSPILADLNSLCPQEPAQQGSIPATVLSDVQPPSSDSIVARGEADLPDHLVRLESTFKRYSSVMTSAARKQGDREGIASALDGIAIDIIETVQELAKATPSTLTEENKKIANNLASRKRKAFSDLLKALRASGFSNSVRADALSHQKDASWLAARPPLAIVRAEGFVQSEAVNKINGYHARMGVLMIALREAFNGHNDDINSQDLERGIGFVESIYATSLQQRDVLTAQFDALDALSGTVSRLRDLAAADKLFGGQVAKSQLPKAEIALVQLDEALAEIEEGIRVFRSLEGRPVSIGDLAPVADLRSQIKPLMASLSAANQSSRVAGQLLYTQDEISLIPQAQNWLASAVSQLQGKISASPELRHLYDPVIKLASSVEIQLTDAAVEDLPLPIWRSSDDLIQRLLVVAQQLKSDMPDNKEDERLHVPTETKHTQALVASLHIGAVLQTIEQFIQKLSDRLGATNMSATGLVIARILPFVEVILAVYASILNNSAYNVKATYKLAYVTGRVMLDLAQKGFCKPQEADDSKDQDGGEGTVEGTGMGAGSGEKNVSNEITEESQVEGLQGEEEEEGDDEGNKDEDDAVSMDDDFDGDMGEGKENEDDEGDDDEEEEDHDEHVGDVDPLDPGAVDEKFWGDEQQEEKKDEGREDLMDQGQEESGEAELSAKEKEQEKNADKKDEKKEDDQAKESEGNEQEQAEGQDGQGEEMEGEEMEQDGDEQGPEGEDEAGQQAPVQDEVAAPEGDTLDLPEDLDFEEDEGMNDDLNMDDKALPEDEEGEAEKENDDIDMASQDDGELMDDAPPAMEPAEEDSKEAEAQLEQNLDVSASNDVSNQENDTAGGASGQGEKEKQEDKEGEHGEDAEMAEEENEADPAGQGAAPKQAGAPSGDQDDQADGPIDSAGAPVASDGQVQQQQRSLGDIMKEIRRRRDEILSQQTQDNPTDRSDAPQEAGGQVEYLGEEDEGDDQALGAAGEEERQKLADLNIVDEDDQEQPSAPPRGMEDVEEEDQQDDPTPRQTAERAIKQEADEQSRPNEKALTGTDIGGNAPTDRPDESMDVDTEDGLEGVKPEIEDAADGNEVELNEDTKLVVSDTDGEATWRQYAALTSDLSYALCEQLRLILEPTLATRLQGDFRTGKRLNMRKIIPYIASEYTKDKIWLRRTKPSRREYQVLLSLDDSRSMADSHSVHLAYQTLALVSQALNKLEVGQVGIAKFGESVDILHPFGTGFSEADGAKVMASFGFDQHRTDVVRLVERTLSFLSEARQSQAASSSAPDLWQLQIIISDGVCQDHAKLRTLLRKALEERVMIVFIIIDSLHTSPNNVPAKTDSGNGAAKGGANARPSILSMQTVEYKNVNGEMSLEMTRYLDTFPFEFFVVLRDVEALPGVLSDTLRQWMTRVSQSQE